MAQGGARGRAPAVLCAADPPPRFTICLLETIGRAADGTKEETVEHYDGS